MWAYKSNNLKNDKAGIFPNAIIGYFSDSLYDINVDNILQFIKELPKNLK